MRIEVRVPTLPESVAEGTLLNWRKQPGDAVARDESLVDIETDKVVLDVPAPENGVLAEIVKADGDTVRGNEVIAVLDTEAQAASDTAGDDERPAPTARAEDTDGPPATTRAAADDEEHGEQVEIRVPDLPESVSEGVLTAWQKAAGDPVARDENLVGIETDKVVLDVPSPCDGVLLKVLKDEGDTVGARDVIAVVSAGAEAGDSAPSVSAEPEASAPAEGGEPAGAAFGPAVRKLLAEHDLDPARIPASGRGGRLTKEDVLDYLERERAESSVRRTSVSAPAPATSQQAPSAPPPLEAVLGDRPEQRVPMTRLRARVAERLVEAQHTAAMLTTFNEVDMGAVMALRKRYQDRFEKENDGTRLGFMSFFLKASVAALQRFPEVNASIDGNDIVYHGYYDVGVAVSGPRGLVVPILRDVDQMSFAAIEQGIADFGRKAQDGSLSLDDLIGGTFTVSNGGIFGSLVSTPILNPPQSAILGMHKIQERPVAVDGEVVVRPMMYLALTYDHRIVDGREAVRFLVTIKEALEDPARLLLQV